MPPAPRGSPFRRGGSWGNTACIGTQIHGFSASGRQLADANRARAPAVPARDRKRLERLARYVARPPVATERLSRLGDGRLLYRLKHCWRDGTTHVVFEGRELVEKLAALVPPPRLHLVRYHGILGPCASARDRVVPAENVSPDLAAAERPTSSLPSDPRELRLPRTPPSPAEHFVRPRRVAWADLVRRVFAQDVLRCPDCGGRMQILAAIHPPEATEAILACLGLPVRAPPIRPARSEEEEPGPWDERGDGARCEDDFGA